MFSTNRRPDRPDYEPASAPSSTNGATVIARGVKVEGDFVSQGDVIIDGEVNGHVMTSGLLTVGTDAKLKAEVAADDAVIAGLVEGTLVVKKRLELKATARVMGDVTCETASIEAGAILHGKCSIGQGKPNKESPKQHQTVVDKPVAG